MTTLSYATIKTSTIAKETEEKRVEAREKALLLFAFQLLVDKGYLATASTFVSECSLDLNQYVMCENIDLPSILIEFEAYHHLRFQRYPQYFRKLSSSTNLNGESLLSKLNSKAKPSFSRAKSAKPRRATVEGEEAFSSHNGSSTPAEADIAMGHSVTVKSYNSHPPNATEDLNGHSHNSPSADEKILKPISGISFPTEEMTQLAEMIQREIVVRDLGVRWNDVVGLENAKMILMESLVYSKEFIDFFGNAFPPWRGLLLYGPPGNGKTMLAKAVANECKTTFFNISSSSVVSKWRGDSEKLVKVLFELAKYHAPSTIFFDEFDALGSSRDSGGESDASRRLKSELLQQMDGLLSMKEQCPVFILAATNIPWDLDPAVLRRLEKRIYVSLPDTDERCEILQTYFQKAIDSVTHSGRGANAIVCNVDFSIPANKTNGYAASDLQHIVKECIVRKFRQQFTNKNKKLTIDTADVIEVIQAIQPTMTPQLYEKFRNWETRFGAS